MAKPGTLKTIPVRDISITPFKVYKSFRWDTTSSMDVDGIQRLTAIKPKPSAYTGLLATISSSQVAADDASKYINTLNGKECSLMYYSLNHLFYDPNTKNNPYDTLSWRNVNERDRMLYDNASILSIPNKYFGERIRPGSFTLTYTSSYLGNVKLTDNGNGNLVYSGYNNTVSKYREIVYLGFDDRTYETGWLENSYGSLKSSKLFPHTIEFNNITFTSSFLKLGDAIGNSYPVGNSAVINSNGYIKIKNDDSLKFDTDTDWSIKLHCDLYGFATPTISNRHLGDTYSYILSKRAKGSIQQYRALRRTVVTTESFINKPQYPFELRLVSTPSSSTILEARLSDSVTTLTLTGSIATGSHSVVFQKTGSVYELYIDAVKIASSSVTFARPVRNTADMYIGSIAAGTSSLGLNSLSGSIDEFYVFKDALTQSEINRLCQWNPTSSAYGILNTNYVGNVFYEHGIVVISDPRPIFGSYGAGITQFGNKVALFAADLETAAGVTGSYGDHLTNIRVGHNSTVTIYENEILCRIRDDEFNFSSNPSLRLNRDPNSDITIDNVRNEYFNPYITTIGLYNPAGELLVVGKLASPIQKRSDVDLNIIIRYDT